VPRDEALMRRALALAERGRTTVSPNPLVGCVVARNGQIVGEGFHARAGGPHAEVVALRAASDRAAGATAYVTLEPCAHHGRTPPCAQALVAAGVTRVVAATMDPDPVAAGGADALRSAGVRVDLGCCEEEARQQNEIFFHGLATGRPFVVVKAAVSLDGRIAAADGTSRWLTGEQTRQRAHHLRAAADAVIVGSQTVLDDDPALTVRLPGYDGTPPLRVVLDRRRRVGGALQVLDDAAPTLLHRGDLTELLTALWDRKVRSALVEGGASVVAAFLRAGLADRVVLHIAPVLLGARGRPLVTGDWPATLGEAPRLRLHDVEQVGDDAVLTLAPSPMPRAARAADPAAPATGGAAPARDPAAPAADRCAPGVD